VSRQLLEKYGLAASRRFGQNFLINRGIHEKIIAAVAPVATDTILEIGPGLGAITRCLAESGARIIAVDADTRMIGVLQQELAAFPNVQIVHADILQFDWSLVSCTTPIKIIGNIPYNITSPILFWLSDHRAKISTAILTMQREVAQRVMAPPGSHTYGALSIDLQVVAHIERLFDISPNSFFPAPKVTSSTIRVRFPDPPPYPVRDLEHFRRVVRTAFGKRRKMLRNTIPPAALEHAQIDPTRRPESLTIEEFVRLAEFVYAA